jgi:hypothetical protein
MIASPPPIANAAPPRFLDGRRIEIRGESASAILYAVDRLPRNVNLDQTVVTIGANPNGPPTVYFWTFPVTGPWQVAFSITVPADVARPPSVPWNAESSSFGAKLDPTLLGVDVHAMSVALRTRPKAVPLADYEVLIEQEVGRGRLDYGIEITKMFFVCCILSCDLQTTVDPATMLPQHWRCVG